MTVGLLIIGDELLNGQVLNTNGAWLGEQLSACGLTVRRMVTVGDEAEEISKALTELLRATEAVVCTGGLGPTHDDVTRAAISEALGRPLVRDEDLLDRLRLYYERRGRRLPAAGALMADVPEGFDILENPVGVAPGLWLSAEVPPFGERVVAVVPGVPREMELLVYEAVLPRLIARMGEAVALQKTLLTVGRGESAVVEQLGELETLLPEGVKLAILPDYGVVRLRLTAVGAHAAEARLRLAEAEKAVRERLVDLVFGEGATTLAAAVGELLRDRGLTLALAESCTGGAVASAVTDVPGASDYFMGGTVVYSNDSKVTVLGANTETLRRDGAVSEAVALELAQGAREQLQADIGLGITGVAGPGGGTPETPVGTVWLGYVDGATGHAVRLQLGGDRVTIKRLTVTAALNLVRRQLLRRVAGEEAKA